MNDSYRLTTPVVFFTYIRLDTTKQAFESIRKAKPTKLYHVSDASNDTEKMKKVESVRKYIRDNVDWECEFITNYAESNMGCKDRIISGLDWVFSKEEKAIVIEDDVVVSQSFYRFAEEMLNKYVDNEEVMMVTSGNGVDTYANGYDYWFSRNCSIWGWATWRRAWAKNDGKLTKWPEYKKSKLLYKFYDERAARKYDRGIDDVYNGRLNTWDYGWLLAKAANQGFEIVPKVNMMINVGIESEESTHNIGIETKLEANDISFPLNHPKEIVWEQEYDKEYANIWHKTSRVEMLIRKVVPASWLRGLRRGMVKVKLIKE